MNDDEARALGERWIKAGGGCPLGALGLWRQGDETPWSQRVTETDRGPIAHLVGIDLRDPATRGAALDVVRERWREPSYSLTAVDESCHPIRWRWEDGGLAAPMLDHPIAYQEFTSEADALVAALEAVRS